MSNVNKELIKKIEAAKVYDVAVVSSLDYAQILSANLSNNIYMKREDQQCVFSFKLRGAYTVCICL